jgi:hypothetical protein
MINPTQILTKSFNFTLGNTLFSSSYFLAGLIVFLLFILVLTLAQVRRHFIDWSFKGGIFGIFWGFLLALILEGFLLISGRTAVTEVLGWKNAPKPILTALDLGRAKLVNVLGMSTEIPATSAKTNTTSEEVVKIFQTLNPSEAKKARFSICQP